MRLLLILLALVAGNVAQARFDCGRHQRAYFHIKDTSLNLALEWARKFQHTDAHEGAVVVQRRSGHDSAGHPGGHVSRIVRVTGPCHAVVNDEAGTYERDICRRLVAYVDPSASIVSGGGKRAAVSLTSFSSAGSLSND